MKHAAVANTHKIIFCVSENPILSRFMFYSHSIVPGGLEVMS